MIAEKIVFSVQIIRRNGRREANGQKKKPAPVLAKNFGSNVSNVVLFQRAP